jgi:hypothetical protein
MASADEHPALHTEHSDLPNVTLVLPAHLDADQALRGLLTSIEQTRDGLLSWARRFRQLDGAAEHPGLGDSGAGTAG